MAPKYHGLHITRFLLFLQQDENWRNMYLVKKQGHRNNECLFKKYFTAFFYSVCYHQTNVHNGFKSILAPKHHGFSQYFYEIFFLHKDENWRNVSWKHNGIEMIDAPTNKILPQYHQTKYLSKLRFHNGIIWIFNQRTSNVPHFWRQNTTGFHEILAVNVMKISRETRGYRNKMLLLKKCHPITYTLVA